VKTERREAVNCEVSEVRELVLRESLYSSREE